MSTAADRDLIRRLTAEGVGTAFLVAIVVGSGIAAADLSPGDTGLQLLENALATAFGLVALITAFAGVSGAHFNPVVTLSERLSGALDNREATARIVVQVAGGCLGAVVANVMFDLPAVEISTTDRSGANLFVSEVVATFGLLVVIFAAVRSGQRLSVAWAVGGYIGAAYFFTSSTSFANPAVTVARTLSDTFAGIEPASVPAFVVAQLVGLLLAVAVLRVLVPEPLPDIEDEIVHSPTEGA